MGQQERSTVKEEVDLRKTFVLPDCPVKDEIVVSPSLEKLWEEQGAQDVPLPAPLANGAFKKILKELPEGARVAAETCVQFWKVEEGG
eukprot:747902-Hanusia_phi.AAC.3